MKKKGVNEMEAQVLFQALGESPRLQFIPRPVIDLGANQKMTFCVLQGGMANGDPSVLVVSMDHEGSVILQTSVERFLAVAAEIAKGCEEKWEWTQPVETAAGAESPNLN